MNNYKDNPIAAAYVAMNEKKVVERASWVPEEITDEGAAEFMGAAANAAKKGDKTFKFGDKEYKVTMKKDTVDAITKKESVEEVEEVAEPEAKGEKDFKDMHTKNTKKSGEKDDGTVVKEDGEVSEVSSKTLANYIKKSSKDADVQDRRSSGSHSMPDVNKDAKRRGSSRRAGMNVAIKKLVNKEADKNIEKKRVKRPSSYHKEETK